MTAAPPIVARLGLRKPGFDLNVEMRLPGQGVSALFGPSGSGKTTCLRCLAGLERADEAYIEVAGHVWQDSAKGIFVPPHRRALGYVFQEASLFEHLSVRDNLLYGFKRVAAAQRKIEMSQATALLGIDALLERRPGQLSGGERQRVGIARALLTSPGLLLMDEPLAALDSARKAEILPYLERLHRELAIPVVYVSHSQQEVARLADHLVLLDEGQVSASGPIAATLARLDLPLARQADASVVIEGTVAGFDAAYQLLDLRLPGSALSLRIAHDEQPAGSHLRVAVQARDVSLSLQDEHQSSILNRLPATVMAVASAANTAHVLVNLEVEGTPLLARITRYSAEQLDIAPGVQVWAQIKSVAVLA